MAVGRLDGVAGNGPFPHGTLFTYIDVNIGRGFVIQVLVTTDIVVFNIIPGDLKIPYFAVLNSNATKSTITDVRVSDD